MSNRNHPSWPAWIVTAGLLLIMAGVLLPILGQASGLHRYLYAAGALASLAGRLCVKIPDGLSVRVKRLLRIETWSSIFFCVAAVFMFWPGAGSRDWLAFTLAGGAILIYTSIMIPRAARRGDSQAS